ncbi:MAG: RdgB/HAM1 family non-canonical purine NTP pyrophosphatase [Selenomonadaceae bacterium]|nr:RdgB/HAM1 family non-canonical purine NTP pyrophosphatase [Selenomonadaceae bacterium]
MKKIVIATKNEKKILELKAAFSALPVEILSLDDFGELPDAIEDGNTFEENAEIKARFFMSKTNCACLADDSGLEVDALNGLPGVHSARFVGYHGDDAANNQKLLDELDRVGVAEAKSDYRCALVFIDLNGTKFETQGICYGTIKKIARGTGGFGYDPYFYFDSGKTMAELSLEEKDKISHRGAALRQMVDQLKKYLSKR